MDGKFRRVVDKFGRGGYLNTETGELFLDTPPKSKRGIRFYNSDHESNDFESNGSEICPEIDYDEHDWE